MSVQNLSKPDIAGVREEWLNVIETAFRDVEAWAAKYGWRTERSQTTVREDLLDAYDAPMLTIETERGQVILEPIARMVYGANGRIDFYAYPSLYRVKLLWETEEEPGWAVRTDSGIDWPNPWGKKTFHELALALLRR